jgi:pimeloyl-ACP methyl ester carboxylesterase
VSASSTVVLVHGLWHGAWCWDAVIEALRGPDVAAVALDLPMRSLAGDASVLHDALDHVSGTVVLVGHSYGGAVITAAGTHPSVSRLVYLAGFLLDATESISRVAPERGIAPTGLGAAMRFSADGQDVVIDPDLAAQLLYNRTPAAVANAAIAKLRPVARGILRERPAHTAWRDVPASYVVCSDDRTVAPDLQRVMAARAAQTYEWNSDHSPSLSRPAEVADLLAAQARATGN